MDDTTFLTLGAFLIGIGFLLLVADLFLTSGVLLVLALGFIMVGLTFIFKYDMQHKTNIGLYSLGGVVIAVPLTAWLMFRVGPMRRMVHSEPAIDDTIATIPNNQDLERLRGRFGKTISWLRPGGVVDFDGRRIDTLTEGMMIEPGQWVRCIDVQAGKVIVRRADHHRPGDLETNLFKA
jgi:membrane-bound serine protease (ClpP class)